MKSTKPPDTLKTRPYVVGNDILCPAASPYASPIKDILPEENLDFDLPIVIFPEWNDADIAAEKWTTKTQFEDSDTIIYPRSLRGNFDHYKKPTELVMEGQTPVIIQSQMIQDEIFYGKSPLKGHSVGLNPAFTSHSVSQILSEDPSFEINISTATLDKSDAQINIIAKSNNASQINIFENEKVKNSEIEAVDDLDPIEKTSKLFQTNKHLLNSRLMTNILFAFHFIYEQGKIIPEETLFDCIYPKGKDGSPIYNPSGKYAIKLFWLGSWRKVIVDDRIPFSVDGKPIIITSPLLSEIWPVLITKALLKIAVYRYYIL